MVAITEFADLFDGNREAIGLDHGQAVRLGTPKRWLGYLSQHLAGDGVVGVYPVKAYDPTSPGPLASCWVCKFGVVDFDVKSESHSSYDYETEDEAHDAALNLQLVLAELGVTAWIERTRSHGRHIWAFASQWIPAATMRRALLVASEIAGTSTREVNPKSEALKDGQLGNYIRLPFGGNGATVFATGECPMDLDWFVQRALLTRTSPEVLQKIADLYRSPSKPQVPKGQWGLTGVYLNAKGLSIWECGPNDGDRSRGMSYLARQCFESGLTPETAFEVLSTCEWNKFAGRADELKRLTEIVEGAYG